MQFIIIAMMNYCKLKAREECHQIHVFKKNNHSGECKNARAEFENVYAIPKKQFKQRHQKCSMIHNLFSEIDI